jgi:putative spermidine/putrescine transport system substrate-binding protein
MGNEPPRPIPRERGFFDKRNPQAAPNIKNVYDKALVGDTSLAIFWARIGLAYRTDMGLKRPASWKDFWDASYDGKRGIYVIGNTLGINFLFMADKIHGKDYFDVDAGIAAVKRLQAKMVDFTGTMQKHLESKEVGVAVLHDGDTYDLAKRGIPVDWVAPSEGVPILDQVIQVTRGSKNKDLAWKLIDMYLSPEVQTAFATELFFSPTNKTVRVPPDVAKKLISGPADVEKLVTFDWNVIAKQRPQWTERWNKELR